MSDPVRLRDEVGRPAFDRAILRASRAGGPRGDVRRAARAALGLGAGAATIGLARDAAGRAARAAGSIASPAAIGAPTAGVHLAAAGAKAGADVGASLANAGAGTAWAAVGKLVTAALASAAIASGAWVVTRSETVSGPQVAEPTSTERPATASSPDRAAAPAPSPAAAPSPRSPSPAPDAPPPNVEVNALPSASPRRISGAPRAPSAQRGAEAGASTLRDEIARLDEARLALRGGRSTDAIRALHTYMRTYPRGALAPEAQLLLIDADWAAGDRAAARAEARRHLAASPNSAAAARLREMIDTTDQTGSAAP